MRFTLSDVAREAGVSTATVDRVLNNRSGVRARTREIVLETATRLGYIAEEDGTALSVDRLPWHDHAAVLTAILNTVR